jgi:hypothetical protein
MHASSNTLRIVISLTQEHPLKSVLCEIKVHWWQQMRHKCELIGTIFVIFQPLNVFVFM